MIDPLADVVALLRPRPSIAKQVTGGGSWLVERRDLGQAFYCAILEGTCRLTLAGRAPLLLEAGDFVLVPEAFSFTMSSREPPPRGALAQRLETSPGVIRLGDPAAPTDLRAMVGHCSFGAGDKGHDGGADRAHDRTHDRALLVSLLPDLLHLRGSERLIRLATMIHEEAVARRAAGAIVLAHLLEVLFIEALRSAGGAGASPGLLRGLTDAQLAPALRRIHEDPAGDIRVDALAKVAAMSRSTFYARFQRAVGLSPMDYVTAWRMALAGQMLRRNVATAEIAEAVGYGSVSAFSTAFRRHAGLSPGAYARGTATATAREARPA